jgi:aryl-alcohol dehydrogenase-like predicted oxidoreductase
MEFRRFGSSGLHCSTVAYGNFLTHGEKVDVDLARDCVHAALDEGITTFDTADSYAGGAAEEVLGKVFRDVSRDTIEICTKVFFPVAPEPARPNAQGLSRKHVMEAIDGSLKRLGMDYIDLYQAHRYDPNTPLEETIQAFADVVKAGKALYVGISEWPAEHIAEAQLFARRSGTPLIANQVQYSMLRRSVEDEVAPVCENAGIGLWAWSALAQGVLSGKYLPGQPAPPNSRAVDIGQGSEFIRRWLTDDVLTAVQELRQIAEELGVPLARLALGWVLAARNVSAVVVGGSTPEQIKENASAATVAIPADALSRIETVINDLQAGQHAAGLATI